MKNRALNMPLNAIGWSSEEDETLVGLVITHPFLYNVTDPSRKNILARESTWQDIAKSLHKPVEECKKRWRCIRDGYMRSKRVGSLHKTKAGIYEKLKFLDSDSANIECSEEMVDRTMEINDPIDVNLVDEQVITDNQEYYEITVVDGPQEPIVTNKPFIKILPKTEEPPKKIMKKNAGRKKYTPLPRNSVPVKILPKPIIMNGPKVVSFIEDQNQKTPEQRSQVIDKLIEKVLKENTNEIDVFFRSMAASVKKLQPNLIPKVKMEVCNVIAKYEMQSFDRHNMQ